MRSSLVVPELLQAMSIVLFGLKLYVGLVKKDGPQMRVSFVRRGSVVGKEWVSQGRGSGFQQFTTKAWNFVAPICEE